MSIFWVRISVNEAQFTLHHIQEKNAQKRFVFQNYICKNAYFFHVPKKTNNILNPFTEMLQWSFPVTFRALFKYCVFYKISLENFKF